MKKVLFVYISLGLFVCSSVLFAQRVEKTEAIALSYFHTLDNHVGGLLSYQSYLTKQVFYTYALGVSQSHVSKKDIVLNFDIGYRFQIDHIRPDVRLGFGYLFGHPKKTTLDPLRETLYPKYEPVLVDETNVFLSTYIKVGFLNWDLPNQCPIPIRLIANLGVQYQYPMYNGYGDTKNALWHVLLETGISYHFN